MNGFLEKGKKGKKNKQVKEEIKKIKKEGRVKNLSRHQENQALLKAVKERRTSSAEEIIEKDICNGKRTFICKCGVLVTLNGDTNEGVVKCSKCQLEGRI